MTAGRVDVTAGRVDVRVRVVVNVVVAVDRVRVVVEVYVEVVVEYSVVVKQYEITYAEANWLKIKKGTINATEETIFCEVGVFRTSYLSLQFFRLKISFLFCRRRLWRGNLSINTLKSSNSIPSSTCIALHIPVQQPRLFVQIPRREHSILVVVSQTT